jgi:hypothetical protein
MFVVYSNKMSGYGLGNRSSIPGMSRDLLLVTIPRTALGPTQPPIERLPGIFPREWNGGKIVKLVTLQIPHYRESEIILTFITLLNIHLEKKKFAMKVADFNIEKKSLQWKLQTLIYTLYQFLYCQPFLHLGDMDVEWKDNIKMDLKHGLRCGLDSSKSG